MRTHPAVKAPALHLPRSLNTNSRELLLSIYTGLPMQFGSPVSICLKRDLTNYRGKLLSGKRGQGTPVHAAAFIRQRKIVLESALLSDTARLRLICTHECFHFVWPRLGNTRRREFSALLQRELRASARGELGESAMVQKSSIVVAWSERRWRDYSCEAFCDTGAYLYGGVAACGDFTLSARWVGRRQAWFRQAIDWEARCF